MGESVSATMAETVTVPTKRESKFRKQRAGQPALESDRNINGDQHRGHGDDRPAKLARGLDGRSDGFHTLADMAVAVLHHDDGVIHDQADGEHHGEQRQQVDGEARHRHHHESADDGKRDRHHGNGDRPHIAQEHEHNECHDSQRLKQRRFHFVDGAVDEFGGIVNDLAFKPFRQRFDNLREDFVDARQHVDQIRIGRGTHRKDDGIDAVEGDACVVIVGAQHDVGHVLKPDDGAVGLPDDEILELVHRMKAGRGIEIHRDHLAFGVAETGDVVVGGERRIHVRCRQPVGRQPLGVEPDAHGEILRAKDLHALHAGNRLQLGLHHARDVIGNLVLLQKGAAEADIHGGGGLSRRYRNLRLLRLRRQLVGDRRNLGADLGQRLVGIVVELKRGRNRADAACAWSR